MPHSMARSRIRVSSNKQVAQRAAISQLRDIIYLWGPLRCSRAANFTVSGPIWLKFELILFFVLVTWKFNSIRSIATKKKWKLYFLDIQGQLTQ